jgi:hypothetical protein
MNRCFLDKKRIPLVTGFFSLQFLRLSVYPITILIDAPQAAAYRSRVETLALLAFLSNLLTAG